MGDNKKDTKSAPWREILANKLIRMVIFTGILSFILYYAGKHSVTFSEFTIAFASIPLSVVILAEILDKVFDMDKYYNNILNGIQRSFGIGREAAAILMIFIVMLSFLVVTWLSAGTITMNLGEIMPPNFLAGATVALYIFAPNTGKDEWLLWLWIAATIVTGGSYLVIFPAVLLGVI